MPEIHRESTVRLPLSSVWRYIADTSNWAPQIPGYERHEVLSDRRSTWWLRGDVGILSRTVELNVEVTEWVEPEHVSFVLEGAEEPVTGRGAVAVAADGPDATGLRFDLSLQSGGAMGPVINTLLMTQLPRIADGFLRSLEAGLFQAHGAPI